MVRCYEVINGDGERYVGPKNEIRYIASGGARVWMSHCRRGFRYVEVTVAATDKPVSLKASAEATGYPTGKGIGFTSSDMLLDRVCRMCEDTARVCMADAYIDCPGYEQNIWTGDARITALLNLLSFGAFEYNADYLRLIAESLSDSLTACYRPNNRRYIGRRFLTCGVFPTYPDGNIPIWSFQWILSVHDHYMHTGDIALLEELLPAVRESLKRAECWYSPRGLLAIEGAWNLADWANNDLSEYGEVTVNNMMLVGCFRAAADMERGLGRQEAARGYEHKAEALAQNINRYCWSEADKAYVDTVRDEEAYELYLRWLPNAERDGIPRGRLPFDEFASMKRISVHTAAFAVLYGIADGERLSRCAEIVIDQALSGLYVAGTPAARTHGRPSEAEAPGGIVRVGSPFFMFFMLDALYKLGRPDLAEHAIRRDWGRMLEVGLETCPEVFSPPGRLTTRSIAHAWSASPAVWLASEALGVRPLRPGYAEFEVRPSAATLRSVEGSIQTPRGAIHVSWKRCSDGSFDIHCEHPEGIVWVKNS